MLSVTVLCMYSCVVRRNKFCVHKYIATFQMSPRYVVCIYYVHNKCTEMVLA